MIRAALRALGLPVHKGWIATHRSGYDVKCIGCGQQQSVYQHGGSLGARGWWEVTSDGDGSCARGMWWQRPEPPALPASQELRPIEDEPFSYPPGLDLSAFWFRLDFSGPKNPRDPGFEWAWNKPLLDTEVVERENRLAAPRRTVTAHLPLPEAKPESDKDFQAYFESEYVSYDEWLAVKAGKLPTIQQRLRDFDDRYERPSCKCGRSHPELHTPMNDAQTDWAVKDSFYRCIGCKRKWQSRALRAALALEPIPETVKVRKRDEPLDLPKPPKVLT